VQFTRNPNGITGALKKIGGSAKTAHASRTRPRNCRTCFSATASANRSSACSKRIRRCRIASAFSIRISTENFPTRYDRLDSSSNARRNFRTQTRAPLPNIFRHVVGGAILASGYDDEKPPVIKSRHVLPNIGNPTPLHLEYAVKLRDALPENVKAAAREPLDAVALIYALLLSAMKNCARRKSPNWKTLLAIRFG
jgi:hypothetical protein